MRKHNVVVVLLAMVALTFAGAERGAAQASSNVEQIRKELLRLPYYGVFDFLAFKSESNGVVTLMGYAYHPALKSDAERAVKRITVVKEVSNKIEELPPSAMDDDIRWKTYYAIYYDPILSRYAPGGGNAAISSPGFTLDFRPLVTGPFVGMEPAGDYPIHIIVKGSRLALFGVVDSDSDKVVAEMKARQVPGALGVEDYLVVAHKQESTER